MLHCVDIAADSRFQGQIPPLELSARHSRLRRHPHVHGLTLQIKFHKRPLQFPAVRRQCITQAMRPVRRLQALPDA